MAEEDASVSNLFKEIDDELRQDKATKLWKQYGNTFIGTVVAIVIAVGAYEGWKAYDRGQREELGTKYESALELARDGNFDASMKAFKALSGESNKGYGTLARMQEAGILAQEGKYQEAADLYYLLAQNGEIDSVFRDMALILGSLNALEVQDGKDIINRLQPLVGGSNAWRYSAMELQAFAFAKSGEKAKALEIMKTLAQDAGAPPAMRQRAGEFAKAYAN